MKSVVLISGGMDSLVTAAIAVSESSETYFLHVNYGQKTSKRELESFERICEFYRPQGYKVIELNWFKEIGGSSLTDANMPILDHGESHGIPFTYVPFRNANLLCMAVSWAEVIAAERVYIGAVEEDSSGYPDCRKVFFKAFDKAIESGTATSTVICIHTPVIDMNKAEIVSKGMELGVPFEFSWSCYKNDDIACGKCDSCQLRLKAFRRANAIDPIQYYVKEV